MIKIINEVDFSRFNSNDYNLGEDDAEWKHVIPKKYILGANLLSLGQAKKHKKSIPPIKDFWWTNTPSDDMSVFASYSNNSGFYHLNVTNKQTSVIPTLILNATNSNLDRTEYFEFGGIQFKMVSNNLAIAQQSIGESCFNKNITDGSDYETSYIKKLVDNWFNKAYAEYEG